MGCVCEMYVHDIQLKVERRYRNCLVGLGLTAVEQQESAHDCGWVAINLIYIQDDSCLTAVEKGIDLEKVLAR